MGDEENRRSTDPILIEIRTNQIEIMQLLKQLSRAFPLNEFGEPDFDGHRKHHAALIKMDKDVSDVRVDAVKKVVTGGIGIGFPILCYALWDYLKAHLK